MSLLTWPRARVALGWLVAFTLGCLLTTGLRDSTGAGPRTVLAATRPLGAGAMRLVAGEVAGEAPELCLEFDTPMVKDEFVALGGAERDGLVLLDPPVGCSLRWRTPTTLELRPRGPLARATSYHVAVQPGLRALDGRRLDRSVVFELPTPGPRVTAIVPAELPREQPGFAALAVELDLPIRPADFERAWSAKESDGALLRSTLVEAAGKPATAPKRRFVVALERPTAANAAAAAPAAPPTRVTIVLDGTLASPVGARPLGATLVREVALTEPLRCTEIDPDADGLWLRFNRALPGLDPALVTLDPPTRCTPQLRYGALFIAGDLPPARTVTVRLAAGFPGVGVARLDHATTQSAFVADRAPTLAFAHAGETLSSVAEPELEIASVNVPRFYLSLRRVYANNVVLLAHDLEGDLDPLAATPITRTIAVAGRRNEPSTTRVALAALIGAAPRGAGIAELRPDPSIEGGRWWSPVRRLLQVSDLAITARVAGNSAVLSVRTLAANGPAADSDVALWTPTNQLLARGKCDADGLCRLAFERGDAAHGDRVPWLVTATRGEEVAWVALDRHAVDFSALPVGGLAFTRAGALDAVVHATRGIVRPGEPLEASALVRERDGRAANGAAVIARWLDARGRLRRRDVLVVPGSGLVALTLPTAAADPTGQWRLELLRGDDSARDGESPHLGEAGFLVEAFVPDRLEVKAELADPAAPLVMGEPGELVVSARWLAGGAVAGRRVVVRPRFDLAEAVVPRGSRFDAFSFGAIARSVPPGDLAPIETVTDADGRARVRFAVPIAGPGVARLSARLVVEVDDPSGRAVRSVASAPVVRAGFVLGVRAGQEGADVVALDRGGAPVAVAAPVTVELLARRFNWEFDESHGRWECRAVSTLRTSAPVDLAQGGVVRVALAELAQPVDEGWLVVVVRCGEQVAEQELGAPSGRPDRLEVSAPKEAVHAGASFEVAIDAPFAGAALVTLEGDGIHAARSVVVPAGRSTVALEVPATFAGPNAYAVVTLARPQARKEATPPLWVVGAAPVAIDRSERFVAVALRGPDAVEPGQQVEFELDAPGASAATVALVDAGILQMTRHRDADPRGELLAQRRLDTRGADTRTSLLDGARYAPEKLVGGDTADDRRRLQDGTSTLIRSVALFSGVVALDAQGHGRVRFTLPEYEGKLRACAIVGGADVVGAAARDLVVAAPLSLQVAAPRLLASGDLAQAVVTLRNRSGVAGEVALELTASGALALGEGAVASRRIALADGAAVDLPVALAAGRFAGDGALKAVARLGALERAVTLSLPVRTKARFERRRESRALAAGETELPFDGGWLGDTAQARLVLDTRPDRQLEPLVRALVQYPYGCVEQTTSRCNALLVAHQLLPQLLPEPSLEAAKRLQAGIERLLSMQTDGGGFAFWPGGDEADRFGTVYALDLLLRAKAAGFDVPAGVLERAVACVERWLPTRGASATFDCFAVELLGRAGRPIAAPLADLRERPRTRDGSLLLGLALARLGRGDEAKAQLDGPVADATDDELQGLFATPLRSDALELKLRLALDPGDPRLAPLVERLTQSLLRPERLTTQEQSQLLDALCGWWARFASPTQHRRAIVRIGDERREVGLGEPVEFSWSAGAALRIECDAPLFTSLELSGWRVDPASTAFPDLELERLWIDVERGTRLADGAPLERGHLYDVVLRGTLGAPAEQLLLSDLLPGGVEPESSPVAAGAAGDVAFVETRDDRVLFFFGAPQADGRFELRHRVRAVFPGRYESGGAALEALYQPGRVAVVASRVVEVAQ